MKRLTGELRMELDFLIANGYVRRTEKGTLEVTEKGARELKEQ